MQLRWIPSRDNELYPGDTIVWVNVEKLSAAWSQEKDSYIMPNNLGDEPSPKYEKFGVWFASNYEIIMPCVYTQDERIHFVNGRNRFAWLRDRGVKFLPVTTELSSSQEVNDRFGTDVRISEIPTSVVIINWLIHLSRVFQPIK